MICKNNIKYTFIFNRDFIYKAKIKNVHNIAYFKNFLVSQHFSKNSNYFESISSFIFLFDMLPYIVKIKKIKGSKTFQALSHIKQTLSKFKFFDFLTRVKNEEVLDIKSPELSDTNFIRFSINIRLFDEFVDLYEYFTDITDIHVSCNVVHCKNQEEKKLLMSGLLLL